MAGSQPSSSWRRHPDLNRGIAVLQTAALPLGYAAPELERETGFEPATSTLARLHSTAELFPLVFFLKHRYFKKLLLSLSRIKQNKTGYRLLPIGYWFFSDVPGKIYKSNQCQTKG